MLEANWKKNKEFMKSIPELIAFQTAEAAGVPELKLEEEEGNVEFTFDTPIDEDQSDLTSPDIVVFKGEVMDQM